MSALAEEMRAIVVREHGGPEGMRIESRPRPAIGAHDVLVRVEAAGVNFIDVYQRSGIYRTPTPFTPGNEGAGTVVEAGTDVRDLSIGDRVAFVNLIGSFAEYGRVPAERAIRLPDALTTREAAALMLQGMTAHYLAHSTYEIAVGDVVLVHAAAGGVGLLLCQMAHALGAHVIGTVSTAAKAELARGAGVRDVILYTERDFVEEVRRITGGRGADVVYDSVGAATFDGSMRSLRPRGMLVLFGGSSGPVPPFDPQLLNRRGSLFLTRPNLAHYIATPEELRWRAESVMQAVATRALTLRIEAEYPLDRAAEAFRALESRRTSGKLLLIP